MKRLATCSSGRLAGLMVLLLTPVSVFAIPDFDLAKIPVYNQGTNSFCYAYGASSLLDYERLLSNTTDGLTSPSWTALQYSNSSLLAIARQKLGYDDSKNPFQGGGVVREALFATLSNGLCTQNELNRITQKVRENLIPKNSSQGAPLEFDEFFNELIHIYNDFHYHYNKELSRVNPMLANPPRQLTETVADHTQIDLTKVQTKWNLDSAYRSAMASTLASIRNHFIVSEDFVEELIQKSRRHPRGLLGFLSDSLSSCKRVTTGIKPSQIKSAIIPTIEYRRFIQFIQETLGGQNPRPLALSFCSSIFGTGEAADIFNFAACGYHVNLIIGHRNGKNGPELLLQNFSGPGCQSYHSRWECIPDRGAAWIDASVVYRSSTALDWISPRKN